MKKIIFLSITVGLTLSSCSKEPLEKNPTFFFFQVKYGTEEMVRYGDYEYNNIYEGPQYRWIQQNDSSILSVWPDYRAGRILSGESSPILFSRKGSDILGEYTVRGNIPYSFRIDIWSPVRQYESFVLLPGTEKLNIIKTGDSKYGKYAEGTMTFETYLDLDTVNIVHASATFRLKMN
jgi:hypothetical protein